MRQIASGNAPIASHLVHSDRAARKKEMFDVSRAHNLVAFVNIVHSSHLKVLQNIGVLKRFQQKSIL